jgi:hypothetical protein
MGAGLEQLLVHLLADHVALSLEERVALLRRLLGEITAKSTTGGEVGDRSRDFKYGFAD